MTSDLRISDHIIDLLLPIFRTYPLRRLIDVLWKVRDDLARELYLVFFLSHSSIFSSMLALLWSTSDFKINTAIIPIQDSK